MSQSAEIIIVASVERALVPRVWPAVESLLRKGLTKATDVTLEGIIDGLRDGTDKLWVVMSPNKVRAAFLTAVWQDEETGEPFLGVYGLGGEGIRDWASRIDEAAQEEAKAKRLHRIRFCGRKAYEALLPGLIPVGERMGAVVYERAI